MAELRAGLFFSLVIGRIVSSPNSCIKVPPPPGLQSVTLLRIGSLLMYLAKMKPFWSRVAPKSNMMVSVSKWEIWIQRRSAGKGHVGAQAGGGGAASPGTRRSARSHQLLGRPGTRPSQPAEGSQVPASRTTTARFCPLSCPACGVLFGSPSKLKQVSILSLFHCVSLGIRGARRRGRVCFPFCGAGHRFAVWGPTGAQADSWLSPEHAHPQEPCALIRCSRILPLPAWGSVLEAGPSLGAIVYAPGGSWTQGSCAERESPTEVIRHTPLVGP